MGSLFHLPAPWSPFQLNGYIAQNGPSSVKVRLPERGITVVEVSGSANLPTARNVVTTLAPVPPRFTGVQIVVWSLLHEGTARFVQGSAPRIPMPVGHLAEDFGGFDPRQSSNALFAVETIVIDAINAMHGEYNISTTISIRFRGKFRRYVLEKSYGTNTAIVLSYLLRYGA